MPIFDQGYQHWHGKLSGQAGRWLPITRHGVQVQLKNRWVFWVLLAACLPALMLTCLLAIWGLFEQGSRFLTPFLFFFQNLPADVRAGPRHFRTPLWTLAFRQFFDIQLSISMILVLLVGPDLISQDLRFNAIPLYLSRPLRRFEYFLGKLGVIAVFLSAVTIVPALIGVRAGLWLQPRCDRDPRHLPVTAGLDRVRAHRRGLGRTPDAGHLFAVAELAICRRDVAGVLARQQHDARACWR